MKGLIPEHILRIKPYSPGKPIEELKREFGLKKVIKLASNENPLGPSPLAVKAIKRSAETSHRYPCNDGYYLREAISKRIGIPMSQIILGGGSTDLIKIIARAFLDKEEKVIISEQTFLMYRLAVWEINGEEALIKIPLKNYTYNLHGFLKAITPKVKLIYIANPNNPTGTMISKKEMDDFISKVPENIIVVLDEAYKEYIIHHDFPDGIEYVKEGKKVIVLRTFSKIYGLAGLRVGYGIASEEIINVLYKTKTPFNIPRISQEGALAALDDNEHIEKSKRLNEIQRGFLTNELTALGFEVIPSVANFIMVKPPISAKDFSLKLMKKGVIVRPLDAFEAPEFIRITVGTEEENQFLIEKIKEIINE